MRRLWARACVIVLMGLGLSSTATRVRVWTDEQALWRDAVAKAPHKPRPWVNLGRIAALNGDPNLAEFADRTAIALAQEPGRAPDERLGSVAIAEANLALLVAQRGAYTEAHHLIMHAVSVLPHDPTIGRVATWFTSVPFN